MSRESAEEFPEMVSLEGSESREMVDSDDSPSSKSSSTNDMDVPEGTSNNTVHPTVTSDVRVTPEAKSEKFNVPKKTFVPDRPLGPLVSSVTEQAESSSRTDSEKKVREGIENLGREETPITDQTKKSFVPEKFPLDVDKSKSPSVEKMIPRLGRDSNATVPSSIPQEASLQSSRNVGEITVTNLTSEHGELSISSSRVRPDVHESFRASREETLTEPPVPRSRGESDEERVARSFDEFCNRTCLKFTHCVDLIERARTSSPENDPELVTDLASAQALVQSVFDLESSFMHATDGFRTINPGRMRRQLRQLRRATTAAENLYMVQSQWNVKKMRSYLANGGMNSNVLSIDYTFERRGETTRGPASAEVEDASTKEMSDDDTEPHNSSVVSPIVERSTAWTTRDTLPQQMTRGPVVVKEEPHVSDHRVGAQETNSTAASSSPKSLLAMALDVARKVREASRRNPETMATIMQVRRFYADDFKTIDKKKPKLSSLERMSRRNFAVKYRKYARKRAAIPTEDGFGGKEDLMWSVVPKMWELVTEDTQKLLLSRVLANQTFGPDGPDNGVIRRNMQSIEEFICLQGDYKPAVELFSMRDVWQQLEQVFWPSPAQSKGLDTASRMYSRYIEIRLYERDWYSPRLIHDLLASNPQRFVSMIAKALPDQVHVLQTKRSVMQFMNSINSTTDWYSYWKKFWKQLHASYAELAKNDIPNPGPPSTHKAI